MNLTEYLIEDSESDILSEDEVKTIIMYLLCCIKFQNKCKKKNEKKLKVTKQKN